MFIIPPNAFLIPSFLISPFRSEDVACNHHLPDDASADQYFDNRFGAGNWQYTSNGREAIRMALESFHLDKNDLVSIVTPSQNFYISSCVTQEIENFCRWNREILPETKVIFVNHEFGYPYPEMEKLLATGLPIIEDCCTTFFSQDDAGKIGKYGDFSVYSFPKFFATQLGGLIVSNKNKQTAKSKLLSDEETNFAKKVMSHCLKGEAALVRKRHENFDYAVSVFSKLGFTQRFEKNDKIVPSALLLNNHGIVKDLNKLKTFLYENGVQNSVFYGEDAFFIPCHQNLNHTEMDYIGAVFSSYLKNYNS